MRRSDREMSAEFALRVLETAEYATLSTVGADGQPYGVPLSQVLLDGAVYFHCAAEGHKLENIAAQPLVCVSAVSRTKLVPEKFTTEYDSAIAFGRCEIVTDADEKTRALLAICEKYAPQDMQKAAGMIARSLGETCVCRVTLGSVTGKSNGGAE